MFCGRSGYLGVVFPSFENFGTALSQYMLCLRVPVFFFTVNVVTSISFGDLSFSQACNTLVPYVVYFFSDSVKSCR